MVKTDKSRRLFDELMEAVADINKWRDGKISLNTYTSEPQAKLKSYTNLRDKMSLGARAISAKQTQAILQEMQAGDSVGKGQ